MAAHPAKLSGMQKQVLSLYRGFLRAARSKATEDREKIHSVVSAEFRNNARNVDRRNFIYIEYLLRRGKRQLEQLKDPGTKGLSTLKVGVVERTKVNKRTAIVHDLHTFIVNECNI